MNRITQSQSRPRCGRPSEFPRRVSWDTRHIMTFLAVVTLARAVARRLFLPPLLRRCFRMAVHCLRPALPSQGLCGSPLQPHRSHWPAFDVGFGLNGAPLCGSVGSVRGDSAGRFSFEAPSDALVRLYARPRGKGWATPCLSTVRVDQTEATIRLVASLTFSKPATGPTSQSSDYSQARSSSDRRRERLPISDAWVRGRRRGWATGDRWPIPQRGDGDFSCAASKGNPTSMRSSSASRDTSSRPPVSPHRAPVR